MQAQKAVQASILVLCLALLTGCASEPVETSLLLPVHFSSLPSHLVLSFPFTEQVEIQVRGKERLVERIKQKHLEYPVDLYTDIASDPAGGSVFPEPETYLVPVIEKRISLPRGIEIVKTNPAYIVVCLEEKKEKTVPVTVIFTGEPAFGHIALPARAEPPMVEITGGESVIQPINELKTKAIELNKAKQSFQKKIPLDINQQTVSCNPKIVTVSVPIKKQRTVRIFENIPVKLLNCSFKAAIQPAHITVGVKGPHDTLARKEIEKKINASIDLDGLKPGVYVRKAVIELPVGIIMTKASPELFTVKIE